MITLNKVGIILGNNGNIYLSNFKRNEVTNLKDKISMQKYNEEEYKSISMIGNILRVLGSEGLEVSELLIKELLEFVN